MTTTTMNDPAILSPIITITIAITITITIILPETNQTSEELFH
jgi:hypothetical protein